MDRNVIQERVSILKKIRARLLNACGNSLESHLIFLEIDAARKTLINLADSWDLEGVYTEGHSLLSKIIYVYMPNARKSLT